MTNDYDNNEESKLIHHLPSSDRAPRRRVLTVLLAALLLDVTLTGNAIAQYKWVWPWGSFPVDSSDSMLKMIEFYYATPAEGLGGVPCQGYQPDFALTAGITTKWSCAVERENPFGHKWYNWVAAFFEDGINPIAEAMAAISQVPVDPHPAGGWSYNRQAVRIVWPYKVEPVDSLPAPDDVIPLYVWYYFHFEGDGFGAMWRAQATLYEEDPELFPYEGRKGIVLAQAYCQGWKGWILTGSEYQYQIEKECRKYSHLYGEEDSGDFGYLGYLEANVRASEAQHLWVEIVAAVESHAGQRKCPPYPIIDQPRAYSRLVVDPYLYIDPASPHSQEL